MLLAICSFTAIAFYIYKYIIRPAKKLKDSDLGEEEQLMLPLGRSQMTICSLFGGYAKPDDQGRSLLCVVYSLGKAIIEGFMHKVHKQLDFNQQDAITALNQIYKDVCEKDPKDHYNHQAILLQHTDRTYWFITIYIEDVTQAFLSNKALPDSKAVYLLGLNIENSIRYCNVEGEHCIFVKNHENGQFQCQNSVGENRTPEPNVPDSVIGQPKNYLFKVICKAKQKLPA